MPNVRDQRRRAVGAPLADRILCDPLAVSASGVTTSADRCIALLALIAPTRQGEVHMVMLVVAHPGRTFHERNVRLDVRTAGCGV